jgi:hypothetical protein
MKWGRLEREAKRQLARSSASIDESRSGTPSGKQSRWRVGAGPSSYKEKR